MKRVCIIMVVLLLCSCSLLHRIVDSSSKDKRPVWAKGLVVYDSTVRPSRLNEYDVDGNGVINVYDKMYIEVCIQVEGDSERAQTLQSTRDDRLYTEESIDCTFADVDKNGTVDLDDLSDFVEHVKNK